MVSHLEQTLQRDFESIRALLSRMSGLAVRTLRDCVTALEQGDRQLAGVVILRDQRIDELEKEIDRACLEFLLRHQPAGGHLRFAHAALQINFELERVGDYAESIARQVLRLLDLSFAIPSRLFADISGASIAMLENAVKAFVRQDAELALATAQIEERVDALRNQVNSELMHMVQINQIPLAALTPLMTIARRFERVSDQAKSMCQAAIYFQTGKYAKHQGTQPYRVLFVDDHHRVSRLGEMIGRSLNRSEFEFASAGIEPLPLDDNMSRFIRSKGWAISDVSPRALRDIPSLEQHEVVIALSARAKGQLPPGGRKTIQFDWAMPEELLTGATGAANEYEAAYEQLSRKVSHLVESILGEDRP